MHFGRASSIRGGNRAFGARRRAVLAGSAAVLALAPVALAASPAAGEQPIPIARGPHISGVVHYNPHKPPAGGGGGGGSSATCSVPGSTNFVTNCKSVNSGGRPVNETAIASTSSLLVAGANDYNSYNGEGQDGFYWSTSGGSSWYDAGPINVFPHARPSQYDGAGDPGLALDTTSNGTTYVYYSSLSFNFNSCSVGGVELLYAPAPTSSTSPSWKYMQLEGNSSAMFEDKPAIAVSGSTLYESWTHFGSCSGAGVTSPLQFESFNISGGTPSGGSGIQSVPGSTYSQGSALAPDGSGGFWITWEEFPSASATTGQIQLAHYVAGTGFDSTLTGCGTGCEVISPSGFKDLPSPLPGFKFRDNSFPAVAVVTGNPEVVWTSYDSGHGLAYLWTQAKGAIEVAPSGGGDQFFPSIAYNGSQVYVAYSEGSAAYTSVSSTNSYVQRLVAGSAASTVSTAPSFPNKDAFFSGQFIGDYNQMGAYGASTPRSMWTDLRGSDCCYASQQMNAMVYDAG
jgi:hypothetical protein